MQVGVAGLGRMGREMARNLARAGHDVLLWNRSADKAATLAQELGAEVAQTPRGLSDRCAIVVTMLADDPSSEAVHFGEDGLFTAGAGARIFVEMGTMSPDHIADLAARAPAGVQVIDAPTARAVAGQLIGPRMSSVTATLTSGEVPVFVTT